MNIKKGNYKVLIRNLRESQHEKDDNKKFTTLFLQRKKSVKNSVGSKKKSNPTPQFKFVFPVFGL